MRLITLLMALLATFSLVLAGGPPQLNAICDRESAAFQARHRNQVDSEQANRDQGALWRQAVSVIAQVPVTPTSLQWVQVAGFDFWQDNLWSQHDCAWNSTQAWPRIDAETGEFILAMQRVQAAPTRIYTRTDFSTAPPSVEESESQYTATWVKNAYLEESAIVLGTEAIEYNLGNKVTAAGWYDLNTNRISYLNAFVTFVPGYYRSYTVNTYLENTPGDATTTFKVLADITSTTEIPPALISAAFAWFNEAIEDDSTQLEINPTTGLGEYIFRPSLHLQEAAAKHVAAMPNTEASLNFHNTELMKAVIDEHRQE